MLTSFHRVKPAPRVGWLSLLLLAGGIASAAIAWSIRPGHRACRESGGAVQVVQLTGGPLERSSDSCVLIESVSLESASLVSVDSLASARFDDDLFHGSVENGEVFLHLEKQFDWSDGCTWSTFQTIAGRLSDGHLVFTYEEQPLDGQTGCWSSCRGVARIELR